MKKLINIKIPALSNFSTGGAITGLESTKLRTLNQ